MTNLPTDIDELLGKLIQLWDSYCDEQTNLELYPDIDSFLRHSKVQPTKQAIALEINKARIETVNLLAWKYKELNDQSVDMEFAEAHGIILMELQKEAEG